MPVTITMVLDTWRLKQKIAAYPLKLRVIHQRSVKTYPTIFDLSQEDYRKLSAPRISEALASVRARTQELQRGAEGAPLDCRRLTLPCLSGRLSRTISCCGRAG